MRCRSSCGMRQRPRFLDRDRLIYPSLWLQGFRRARFRTSLSVVPHNNFSSSASHVGMSYTYRSSKIKYDVQSEIELLMYASLPRHVVAKIKNVSVFWSTIWKFIAQSSHGPFLAARIHHPPSKRIKLRLRGVLQWLFETCLFIQTQLFLEFLEFCVMLLDERMMFVFASGQCVFLKATWHS